MFFILNFLSCIFLYGVETTAPQTHTPQTIPKLNLPIFGQEGRSEAGPTEPSSPSSEELYLDMKEDVSFFASLDDLRLDDESPIPPRKKWSIPFQVGISTLPEKTIQLPNLGTPEEIEVRKREAKADSLFVKAKTQERSIEILMLKLTKPQKP